MQNMEVKVSLHLRNGQQVEFVQQCGMKDGRLDIGTLHKSLCSVQQETNEFLTTLVEEERATKNNVTQINESVSDDNDDEEDDDDDEDIQNGPAIKKTKIV